jgi:hypothetical protein
MARVLGDITDPGLIPPSRPCAKSTRRRERHRKQWRPRASPSRYGRSPSPGAPSSPHTRPLYQVCLPYPQRRTISTRRPPMATALAPHARAPVPRMRRARAFPARLPNEVGGEARNDALKRQCAGAVSASRDSAVVTVTCRLRSRLLGWLRTSPLSIVSWSMALSVPLSPLRTSPFNPVLTFQLGGVLALYLVSGWTQSVSHWSNHLVSRESLQIPTTWKIKEMGDWKFGWNMDSQ